jgi:hypothetical protein
MKRRIMRLILGNVKTNGTPSPRGEKSMSVKVPEGTIIGTSHVGESAIG